MHLAIQQGVDKINSLQADMLLPEEIDIELNKAQIRLINTRYGKNNSAQKGFEQSQKRIDDLRSLVTEHIANCSFKETQTTESMTYGVDTAQLPDDYMFLVNARAEVHKSLDCTSLSYTLGFPTYMIYFRVPFEAFVARNSTNYIDKITLWENDSDISGSLSVNLWTSPGGYTYPDDNAAVQAAVAGASAAGMTVSWETTGTLNYPGEFIVVIDPTLIPWVVNTDPNHATLPVTTLLGSDAAGTTFYSRALPLQLDLPFNEKRTVTAGQDFKEYSIPMNFSQQDDIYSLLEDPFNTTTPKRPLYCIREKYLDIYTSDIFIIDTVKMTYIKKPAEISLSLQQSCSLPEHLHREIVDMAISSLLEGISDPRYKSHEMEVSKSE